MAKGVKSITGNASPEVGERNFYEVSSFYPGTAIKNADEIKWKLYAKQSSGNGRELRDPQKTGKKVPFSFPEKWLGKKILIEAFVYNPEIKSPPGLIVTPKSAKIPRISKVELFYVDDKKGSTFSFMEKLRAKAYYVNMFMKDLTFTLWEDDAKGSGHNAKNKPIATQKVRVDKNGVAVTEFMLNKALMKKAMEGEADVKQLEFYVTVEYYKNKKYASENVDVNSPDYNPNPKIPIYPPKKTEPKQPPKAISICQWTFFFHINRIFKRRGIIRCQCKKTRTRTKKFCRRSGHIYKMSGSGSSPTKSENINRKIDFFWYSLKFRAYRFCSFYTSFGYFSNDTKISRSQSYIRKNIITF